MRRSLLLLLALPGLALGQQTTIVDDAWIDGRAGVGTDAPSARLEIQASSASTTVFQISGVDETPFLQVGNQGGVSLSTTAAANLDVWGVADSSDAGVQLNGGSLYPATTGHQILLGYAGASSHRHVWRTRHSTTTDNSSMDFLLWTPAQDPSVIGAMGALSVVTISTGAYVHVRPSSGTAIAELEVSDGFTMGAGTVHRAIEATHSSIDLKKDVQYLGETEERAAFEETLALKPVSFRYKGTRKKSWLWFLSKKGPMRRGLLYEEAPADLRGPGGSVSVDGRVASAELAMKELIRRLEAVSAEARSLESGGRP
ncbi:MAG: hypothetical protein NTX64_00240 [Elusimicrobia bacterium]|nr:hypothetical protein [Elusimicrobiota bacterium]